MIVSMLLVSVVASWILIRKPEIIEPFQIPTVAADMDNDGISNEDEAALGLNFREADTDGDGIPDNLEPKWNDDTDGDGLVNACDTDSDDDWLLDNEEDVNLNGNVDPGETDPLNPDTDYDGLVDGEEIRAGTDPLDNDSDDDGVADGSEPSWNVDSDGDGLINALDSDSDDDNLSEGEELARGTDILDPDSDDDGVEEGLEIRFGLEPLNPDTDNDGLLDGDEAVIGAYWAEAENLQGVDPAQIKSDPDASGGKAVGPKADGDVFGESIPFGVVPAGTYRYYVRVKAVSSLGVLEPWVSLIVPHRVLVGDVVYPTGLQDGHPLKFITEEEVSDPKASPIFPSKLIEAKEYYMNLFIGTISTTIVPNNVYRWYSTPSFTLEENTELLLGSRISNGDALVDRILLVKADNLTGIKLTDPLNPDTDGDGLLDGEEMALEHWWVEAEDYTYNDTQVRDNAEVSNGKDIVSESGTNRLLETPTTYCRPGQYLVYFVRALKGTQASADIQLRVQVQYQLGGSETTLTEEKLVDPTDLYEWRYCGLKFKLETAGSFKITISQTKVGANEVVYIDKLLLARLPLLPPFEYAIFEPREVISIFDNGLDNRGEMMLYEENVYLALGKLATGEPENSLNSYTLTPQDGMAPVAMGRLVSIDVPKGGVDFSGKGVITADPMNPDTDEDGYRPDDGELEGSKGYLTDGKEIDIALNQFDVDIDDDKIPDSLERNPFTDDCDNDGLIDGIEDSCFPFGIDDVNLDPNHVDIDHLEFLDDDTDDDGVIDGNEDMNYSEIKDIGETNPNNPDSDNDGIKDGVEKGLPRPQGKNTIGQIRDWDPKTKTNPLNSDTDGDGLLDGEEDNNYNGRVDNGETDPNNPDTDGDRIIDGEDPHPLKRDYPDLYVSPGDITFDPPNPVNSRRPRIYATIHNVGIVDARTSRIYICFYDGDPDDKGEIIGWDWIGLLRAGTSRRVSDDIRRDATGQSWYRQLGAHTIYVKILTQPGDPHPSGYEAGAVVNEGRGNYSNNKASRDVTVTSLPVADAGPDQGTEPLIWEDELVYFKGTGTDPDGGDIKLYKWEFGDGSSYSSTITGITSHFYDEGRIYTASLTVTDDEGNYNTDDAIIVISSKKVDSDEDKLTNYKESLFGSNPDHPDTDRDGLTDSLELTVAEYFDITAGDDVDRDGLINILDWDSDGDGLSDGDEVKYTKTNGEYELLIDTNPYDQDTDGDGLSDWDEKEIYDTDPKNPDCDSDGLIDGDEKLVYMTSTDLTDSDGDGIKDGYDLQPIWAPVMALTTYFRPGMIRSTEIFRAYGIYGNSEVYNWVWDDFWNGIGHWEKDEDKSDSYGTRLSDIINVSEVKNQINKYWGDIGYEVIGTPKRTQTDPNVLYDKKGPIASYEKESGSKKYNIHYNWAFVDYEVDLKNPDWTEIWGETGRWVRNVGGKGAFKETRPYYYDFVEVSIKEGKRQSVVVQFKLDPEEDKYSYKDDDHYTLPAFQYSLYESDDFTNANSPIFQNIAPAIVLHDHCYEIEMWIPADRATQSPLWLFFMPVWMEKTGDELKKRPMSEYKYIKGWGALAKRIQISDTKEMMVGCYDEFDLRDPIPDESTFNRPWGIKTNLVFTIKKVKKDGQSGAYEVNYGAKIERNIVRLVMIQDTSWTRMINSMTDTIVSELEISNLTELAQLEGKAYQIAQNIDDIADRIEDERERDTMRKFARKVELDGEELGKIPGGMGKYAKIVYDMFGAEIGTSLGTDGRQAAIGFQVGNEVLYTLYTPETPIGEIKPVDSISWNFTLAAQQPKEYEVIRSLSGMNTVIKAIDYPILLWEAGKTDDEITRQLYLRQAEVNAWDVGLAVIFPYGTIVWSFFIPITPGEAVVGLFEKFKESLCGGIPPTFADSAYQHAVGWAVDEVIKNNKIGVIPYIWIDPIAS